jgi:hypothetical protein
MIHGIRLKLRFMEIWCVIVKIQTLSRKHHDLGHHFLGVEVKIKLFHELIEKCKKSDAFFIFYVLIST